jgi:hypothetical protein
MRLFVALALLALVTPAYAADKALILNDQDQKSLIMILDAAAKGYGVQTAVQVARIMELLDKAPTVTAKHDDIPKDPTPDTPHDK